MEDADSSTDNDDEYSGDDTSEVNYTDLSPCSKDTLQKSSAMFLLGLSEKFKLTQAATQ